MPTKKPKKRAHEAAPAATKRPRSSPTFAKALAEALAEAKRNNLLDVLNPDIDRIERKLTRLRERIAQLYDVGRRTDLPEDRKKVCQSMRFGCDWERQQIESTLGKLLLLREQASPLTEEEIRALDDCPIQINIEDNTPRFYAHRELALKGLTRWERVATGSPFRIAMRTDVGTLKSKDPDWVPDLLKPAVED